MIRKNNLGQPKRVEWGHLGKRRVLTNEVFEVIETERKREKYDWKARLQPFKINEGDTIGIMMPEKNGTPTPPPVNAIWNTFTEVWDNVTDEWNNV